MFVAARNFYGRTDVAEKLKQNTPGAKMEKSAIIEKT